MWVLTGARSSSLCNSFWISLTVFGLFCYCHFLIKSRATCRPKSRCQSDLSTVSVLANRGLHQNLMHSGCRGTAVPNVCLQAFSLFPSPVSRSTKGLFTGCSGVSKDLLIYKRQYQIISKCIATLGTHRFRVNREWDLSVDCQWLGFVVIPRVIKYPNKRPVSSHDCLVCLSHVHT